MSFPEDLANSKNLLPDENRLWHNALKPDYGLIPEWEIHEALLKV